MGKTFQKGSEENRIKEKALLAMAESVSVDLTIVFYIARNCEDEKSWISVRQLLDSMMEQAVTRQTVYKKLRALKEIGFVEVRESHKTLFFRLSPDVYPVMKIISTRIYGRNKNGSERTTDCVAELDSKSRKDSEIGLGSDDQGH